MPFFRKKPIVVEARQFIGDLDVPMLVAWSNGKVKPNQEFNQLLIETSEGVMTANRGDWIVKGVGGEFSPCKSVVFNAIYEDL